MNWILEVYWWDGRVDCYNLGNNKSHAEEWLDYYQNCGIECELSTMGW